jgi:hypothetical protein
MKMRRRASKVEESPGAYYGRRGELAEIEERPFTLALDEALRDAILKGQRTRRLKNVSLKLDPALIQAVRKLATMKSIPYQTLIRRWLAENIRKELRLSL